MDTQSTISTDDVARTLGDSGLHEPAWWRRWVKWGIAALIIVIVAFLIFGRGGSQATKYVTQEITRGDITVTVTATGTLEPRNQVDIGSELSGTVRAVNVDFNDTVKAGQVLASLDTSRLRAQVLQAESSLASARARAVQSDANARESKANFQRMLKVRELSGNKLPSEQDMDVAQSALDRAVADVAAAKAAVAQAEANLDAARTDMSKAEIRSPINGVVLVRSVEPGATVAASLQAPVLFTLAEDLRKMELHVSVDEADVGSVAVGQEATFTVDAYPNRSFQARITEVHFASSNTQKSTPTATSTTSTGVVTYETVLEVDNTDLLLRPGMTATAEIVTTSIKDAVLIPNAALRFTPEGAEFQIGNGTSATSQQQRSPLSALMPQMGMRRIGGGRTGGAGRRMDRAWVLEDGKPALAMFRPGPTDGRMTQVLPLPALTNGPMAALASNERFKQALERKLEPGTAVIVDAETPKRQ